MSDQAIADLMQEKLAGTDTPEPVATPEPTPVVEATPTPEPDAIAETPAEKTERARDESGKFAKAGPAKASAAAKGTKANGATTPTSTDGAKADGSVVPGSPPAAEPSAPPATTFKPPQSWKPAAREHFGKLPPEVQAEIDRREREFTSGIQEKATQAKAYQEVQETIRPFEADMVAAGYTVPKALQEWAQLSHTMHRGSPQQKAALAAHLINSMGGDDVIDAINAARQGQPVQQQAQQNPQGFSENQLEAWFQKKAQMAAQQRTQQEWQSAIAADEFGEDVKQLAWAIAQAQRVPPAEAIKLAKLAHPEIGPIMRQREAATAANGGNASVARAKLAASSVRSSPATGVGSNGASLEIEDLLRANLRG